MKKIGLWGDYETKIVCNELHRKGLISGAEWICDASYCSKRFDFITYRGYCLWARPCLRLMQRHGYLARFMAVLVRWMVADIRYQDGVRSGPHLLGFLVGRCVFWPANRALGGLSGIVNTVRARCSWVFQEKSSEAV